jgi:hypothetical protein
MSACFPFLGQNTWECQHKGRKGYRGFSPWLHASVVSGPVAEQGIMVKSKVGQKSQEGRWENTGSQYSLQGPAPLPSDLLPLTRPPLLKCPPSQGLPSIMGSSSHRWNMALIWRREAWAQDEKHKTLLLSNLTAGGLWVWRWLFSQTSSHGARGEGSVIRVLIPFPTAPLQMPSFWVLGFNVQILDDHDHLVYAEMKPNCNAIYNSRREGGRHWS